MATEKTLALRAIRPTFTILQGWYKDAPNPPRINPARRLKKAKMAAAGFGRNGKAYRRYRIALRRDLKPI